MISVIWKFPVPAQDEFTLDLPEGPCLPLTVQLQRSDPTLWIRVSANPNARKTRRTFRVVATGQPFNDEGLLYVGTFQPSPDLVFHLFWVLE
jgi:hypothetical protein